MACLSLLTILFALSSVSAWSDRPIDLDCPDSLERYITSPAGSTSSELRQVYDSLIDCPNTISLHLCMDPHQLKGAGQGFFNLKFAEGDQLPRLQELVLDGYDFGEMLWPEKHWSRPEAHTAMKPMLLKDPEPFWSMPPSQPLYFPGANLGKWKEAMDWTALQNLTLFGIDNIFFWKMAGQLPALENLIIDLNYGRSNVTDYMTDFITSLNPLTSLSTQGYQYSIDWSRALEHHGRSLKSLKIQEVQYKLSKYTVNSPLPRLEEIRRRCPSLIELSVNIEMKNQIPYEALYELAMNPHLTKLAIRLRGNSAVVDSCRYDDGLSAGEGHEVQDQDRYEATSPPQSSFIGPEAVLEMLHYLRTHKQGDKLATLDIYIGNYDLSDFRHYSDWIDLYDTDRSKHTCSLLNEQGIRKLEGEAWCQCEGICEEYKLSCEDYYDDY